MPGTQRIYLQHNVGTVMDVDYTSCQRRYCGDTGPSISRLTVKDLNPDINTLFRPSQYFDNLNAETSFSLATVIDRTLTVGLRIGYFNIGFIQREGVYGHRLPALFFDEPFYCPFEKVCARPNRKSK
jgi:hypothetical protein